MKWITSVGAEQHSRTGMLSLVLSCLGAVSAGLLLQCMWAKSGSMCLSYYIPSRLVLIPRCVLAGHVLVQGNHKCLKMKATWTLCSVLCHLPINIAPGWPVDTRPWYHCLTRTLWHVPAGPVLEHSRCPSPAERSPATATQAPLLGCSPIPQALWATVGNPSACCRRWTGASCPCPPRCVCVCVCAFTSLVFLSNNSGQPPSAGCLYLTSSHVSGCLNDSCFMCGCVVLRGCCFPSSSKQPHTHTHVSHDRLDP